MAQLFTLFQLIPLSFLGVSATFPLAFCEKTLPREALKNSSTPYTQPDRGQDH